MSEATTVEHNFNVPDEYGVNAFGDVVTIRRARRCDGPYNLFLNHGGPHSQYDPRTGRDRTYGRGETVETPLDIDLTLLKARGMPLKFTRVHDPVGAAAAQGFQTIYTDSSLGKTESAAEYATRLRKMAEDAEKGIIPGAKATSGAAPVPPAALAEMNKVASIHQSIDTMNLVELKKLAEEEEVDLRQCKGDLKAIREALKTAIK